MSQLALFVKVAHVLPEVRVFDNRFHLTINIYRKCLENNIDMQRNVIKLFEIAVFYVNSD